MYKIYVNDVLSGSLNHTTGPSATVFPGIIPVSAGDTIQYTYTEAGKGESAKISDGTVPTAPTAILTSNTIVLEGPVGTTVRYRVDNSATNPMFIPITGIIYSGALTHTEVSNGKHLSVVASDANGNRSYADYVVTEEVDGTITAVTKQ